MSDSYIKETYIYEMLVVLLIYLGMPEEYIPIIEVANVDVKIEPFTLTELLLVIIQKAFLSYVS